MAKALISSDFNKGMVGVIAQRKAGIGFSLFEQLRPGVEIATVTSTKLAAAIVALSTDPSYAKLQETADQPRIEGVTFHLEDQALQATGVLDAVLEIGSLVPANLDQIIVSATGALAVRCEEGVNLSEEDHRLLVDLGGGKYMLNLDPYVQTTGEVEY